MAEALTKRRQGTVARPLKTLVPLIQDELAQAQAAGLDHFRRVGQMLIEAKAQMPYGNWGRWLSHNFKLSDRTARSYMSLAGLRKPPSEVSDDGYTAVLSQHRPSYRTNQAWQQITADAKALDAELFGQEQQSERDEIRLHREMAEELIDLGYKAMATRLHPDRGGSKDAMARLNRVRDELKHVATTRRFV